MLYRTHHHPFLFTFNPFSHSSLSPLPLSSSSPSPQAMECVQGASAAAGMDDLVVVNGGGNGDDFFVDELLDFSNDFSEAEEQTPQLEQPEEKEQEKNAICSVSQENETAKDDFGTLTESELGVSAEGLESLEWLSHFVEDSFSDYSLTGKLPPNPTAKRAEPGNPVQEQACFTSPVQTKARTKRARTGVRVWPVLSPSLTESSTSSSSSSSTTTSFSAPNPWTVWSQTGESFLGNPVHKKQKRKPADPVATGGAPVQPRRCSHCGVTKTPQWRAGPMGSKTLCNACGVRFKSGRLLPEYRPACSPTFSSELHSNNHRKVLEMRRKKENEPETGSGLPPPVQSF